MKNISKISFMLVATIIRLIISIIIFPNQNTIDNHNNNILTQTLGPGILPALGAAILDPIHTWDHLQEACFWLDNSPSLWTDALSFGISSDGASIYSAIYTPGTRIVAPPLVVAFLGETLVCPNKLYIPLQFIIRTLLLLVVDGIGAYCIYKLGWRILETENSSNEAEMERHTLLSDKMKKIGGSSPSDLVIPDVLRPERGWLVDLPTKSENGLGDDKVQTNNETAAFDIQKELNRLSMVKEEPIKPVGRGDSYYNEVENDALKRHHPQTTTKPTLSSTIVLKEPIIRLDQLPLIAALLYYCNPISMLANATGSIRSLYDAILLISFYYATLQPTTTSKDGIPMKVPSATKVSICLALVTYADTGYCMFLLPILLWRGLFKDASAPVSIQRAQHHDWKTVLCLYFLYLGGLHFLASLLVGGDLSMYMTVMIRTILPNIAFIQQDDSGSVPGPCLGVHWYMFVQMFDRFRPYFTVFVAGIPTMFAIPLMTRLHRYPSVVAATFQLLWIIYRPTSTAHTLTFGMILALLNPRTIVRMRNPALISFFALPVPILLFVTFHRLWLVTGNGNPNYIFFQCFAYGMFVIIISMDFVNASVKRDKVRRMIEKGSIKKILAEMKEKEMEGESKNGEQEEGSKTNGVQKDAGKKKEDESAGTDDKATFADQPAEPNVVFL